MGENLLRRFYSFEKMTERDRLLGVVKDSLQRGFKDSECSLYEIDPCPTLEELRGY